MADASPLQFERAEFDQAPSVECAQCKTPLSGYYYNVNGHTVCERCRHAIEAGLTSGSAPGRFVRALFAGLGAAVAGALVYYAISALTGYEIGLIAIAVGFAVGTAVRWGSGGRGGRGYQVLAVALTYLAIVSTYIPPIVKGLRERSPANVTQSSTPDGTATETPTAQTATPAQPQTPPGAGTFIVAVLILLAIAAVAPFLAGFQNILGIAIIGFGLWQAWQLNRRAEVVISGPHVLAPSSSQTVST